MPMKYDEEVEEEDTLEAEQTEHEPNVVTTGNHTAQDLKINVATIGSHSASREAERRTDEVPWLLNIIGGDIVKHPYGRIPNVSERHDTHIYTYTHMYITSGERRMTKQA